MVLSVAYLLLAMHERIECWYAAFISTLIYTVLFWQVTLFMESLLNFYYLLMAVYGYTHWRGGQADNATSVIHRWGWREHACAIALILGLTLISGYFLARNTPAAFPYLDSFTTWGAVVTTWMVARKVLENWLYWLVLNPVSVYLFIDRGLALTALLFCVYIVLSVFGLRQWWLRYKTQAASNA